MGKICNVRHKATGDRAIARQATHLLPGTILVQFNSLHHHQSHGWHAYRSDEFEHDNTMGGHAPLEGVA